MHGFCEAAARYGVVFSAQAVGGMFGLYFRASVPTSYAEVMACDKGAFNRFFHAMLDAGIYLAPSAFEAGFVCRPNKKRSRGCVFYWAKRTYAASIFCNSPFWYISRMMSEPPTNSPLM
jgi:hypothetical protein